jgi:AcrR family transcriptional regulator
MSTDTRSVILERALACFVESGYEQTTIAAIRERSGVSNGALFHHFHTKEAIADALYVEAMASFQEGLWELLRRQPRSLRAAVRGTISHQLRWIEGTRIALVFCICAGILTGTHPPAPSSSS